jgi:hypothetical protein
MPDLTARQQAWKAHLDRAEAEGLPLSEYARRCGLKVHSLYGARKRLRQREMTTTTSSLIRVSETRFEQSSTSLAPMTVRLPNGVSISIPYDPSTVLVLLKTLATL